MEYGNDNEQFGRLSSVLSPDGSERDIPKAARIKQNLDPSTLTGGECTMYEGRKIAQFGRFFLFNLVNLFNLWTVKISFPLFPM